MRAANGRALRTVWILGAGFSRSLGGPLLSDLLEPETLDDLRLLYPAPDYPEYTPDYIYGAQQLFVHGRDKEKQWIDAEEYISFLEECAAAPEGRAAKQLEAVAQRHRDTMTTKGKTWHEKAPGLAANGQAGHGR